MISKNSSNKQVKLSQYHWLALMNFGIYIFFLTFPILLQFIDKFHGSSTSSAYFLTNNSTIDVLTVLVAGITGITLYKYLNNKAEVDFYHSLPVRAEEIFWSRYVFGIITFAIPMFINLIVSYLLAYMGNFRGLPTKIEIIIEFFRMLGIYTSVYSFACFGTIVTGNMFLAVCTSLGIMQAPSALLYVVHAFGYLFIPFFYTDTEFIMNLVAYTNPVGYVLTGMVSAESSLLQFLLQAVVLTMLAFHCYKKRPSENSGTPVALPFMQIVIKSLGVICGGSLGGVLIMLSIDETLFNFFFGSFIVSLALHIVFEILFAMDIKEGLGKKREFFILYGMIAVTVMVISLDITGYNSRLTETDQIEKIKFENVTYQEPENLELLNRWITNTVNGVQSDSNHITKYSVVTITTKNGKEYSREYFPLNVNLDEYLAVTTSDEYIRMSHNYNLTEDDFRKMEEDFEEDIERNSSYVSLSVSTYTTISHFSVEEFRVIYAAILSENNKLTADYLTENVPVVMIDYCDYNWNRKQIPVYQVHQTALKLMNLPNYGEPNYSIYDTNEFSLRNKEKNVDTLFSALEPELQELLLEEMTPVYDLYRYYGNSLNSWSEKRFVSISYYGNLMGYMSYETYDELVERYESEKDENDI